MSEIRIRYCPDKLRLGVRNMFMIGAICLLPMLPILWAFNHFIEERFWTPAYWGHLALFGGPKPVGLAIIVFLFVCVPWLAWEVAAKVRRLSGSLDAIIANDQGICINTHWREHSFGWAQLLWISRHTVTMQTRGGDPVPIHYISCEWADASGGKHRNAKIPIAALMIDDADVDRILLAIEAMQRRLGGCQAALPSAPAISLA